MALLDLSQVTTALLKLLEDNIEKVIDTGASVTVTAASPDSVGTVMNTLSLYMYHVGEEAAYKNLLGPGNDARNIARTPMGLCLYYILTVHHDTDNPGPDTLTQQKLMGYALKTLHDYPLLFDGTQIDGQTILPSALVGNDNPVQIIMRPVGPEEAISFWGADDQKATRLSAYYEVRVILLEPDEPVSIPAPVLSLGTYLYQLGAVHLDRTSSELEFDLPETAGGGTQTLEVSPARSCPTDPPHNRLTLHGTNLTLGKSRQLWIRSTRWNRAYPIDVSNVENQGFGWALSVQPDRLVLDIGRILMAEIAELHFTPGIYTAFLRVVIDERIVNGELVPFTVDSNEIPLFVISRIDGVTIDEPNNRIELDIVELSVTLSLVDVFLIVDGQTYVRQAFDPDPDLPSDNDGLFNTSGSGTLVFQALFDVSVAGSHPCRVIINGVESAPFWIEIP
jgi:hypothetical protein